MMSVDKNHNPRKGTDFHQPSPSRLMKSLIDKNHNPRKGTDFMMKSHLGSEP